MLLQGHAVSVEVNAMRTAGVDLSARYRSAKISVSGGVMGLLLCTQQNDS
jgi:hypothetical protein